MTRVRPVLPEPLAIVLAGVGLSLLLYLPSLGHAFTFDDWAIVVGKPDVSGGAPLSGVLTRNYDFPRERNSEGHHYRPAALLALGVETRLLGLDPRPLRLSNLLWAGLGAAAAALLVRSLGGSAFVVWSTLVLVSCHPIRSEVIVSIVGRCELLAFALGCLALLAARDAGTVRARTTSLALASASGLLYLAAAASKESAFPLLALLPLVARSGPAGRHAAPALASWTAAAAVLLAARLAILGGLTSGPRATWSAGANPLLALPPSERVSAALSLVGTAFGKLVWPATLVADYTSRSFTTDQLLGLAGVTAGIAILLSGALLVVLLWKREPLASFGLLWAAVTYLPFANLLFPIGTNFTERLLYAPAAGVVLAFTAGLDRLSKPGAGRRAAVCLVTALAVAGALRIRQRIPDWRDDRTLFSSIVRDAPGNCRAWVNLGILSLAERNAPRAAREMGAALQADPGCRGPVERAAAHARSLGRPEEEAALREVLRQH